MKLSNSFYDNTVESIFIMHLVVDGSSCHGVFGVDGAQHQEEDERVEATADLAARRSGGRRRTTTTRSRSHSLVSAQERPH
jgi:hypothetical protein